MYIYIMNILVEYLTEDHTLICFITIGTVEISDLLVTL